MCSDGQGAAVLGQQEQDTAEVDDPAAEQKMVQNVLDALLQDEEPLAPQVSHSQALPPRPAPCMFAMPPKHHALPQQLAHTGRLHHQILQCP